MSNISRINPSASRKRSRRWSMHHAAKYLGVAASSWSQWENGKRFPSFDMVHHLSVLRSERNRLPSVRGFTGRVRGDMR